MDEHHGFCENSTVIAVKLALVVATALLLAGCVVELPDFPDHPYDDQRTDSDADERWEKAGEDPAPSESSPEYGEESEDEGLACYEYEVVCEGECADTLYDPDHCGGCGSPCAAGGTCMDGQCYFIDDIADMVEAVNEARAEQQHCGERGTYPAVGPVIGHQLLHEAALAHAEDMRDNEFFSHTGSDGSRFSDRIYRTDYQGFATGENLAGGGREAQGVVQRWLDSDGHCANLMNSSANEVGVGYVDGGQYGTLWVLKTANSG